MEDSVPQVVRVAGHPGSSDRAVVPRHEAIALEISKHTRDPDAQLMGEIAEAPSLITRDARAGKRNDRVPMTMQLGVIFKHVPMIDGAAAEATPGCACSAA